MRKDVAKNFYNASKTVCKLFFLYQKLVHVSEILRQSQLRKANFEQKSKAAQMCFCMRRLVAC